MMCGTPLHRAAQRGHKQIINYCLFSGADPLILDELEQSAADLAQQENHQEILKILTKAIKVRQKEIEEENKKMSKTLEKERKREQKQQEKTIKMKASKLEEIIKEEREENKNNNNNNNNNKANNHTKEESEGGEGEKTGEGNNAEDEDNPHALHRHRSHSLGDLHEKDTEPMGDEEAEEAEESLSQANNDDSESTEKTNNSHLANSNSQHNSSFSSSAQPTLKVPTKYLHRGSADSGYPNESHENQGPQRPITLNREKNPHHASAHNLSGKQGDKNSFFSGIKRLSIFKSDEKEGKEKKSQFLPSSKSVQDKGEMWLQYINGTDNNLLEN